jgi:hypothetical protein
MAGSTAGSNGTSTLSMGHTMVTGSGGNPTSMGSGSATFSKASPWIDIPAVTTNERF